MIKQVSIGSTSCFAHFWVTRRFACRVFGHAQLLCTADFVQVKGGRRRSGWHLGSIDSPSFHWCFRDFLWFSSESSNNSDDLHMSLKPRSFYRNRGICLRVSMNWCRWWCSPSYHDSGWLNAKGLPRCWPLHPFATCFKESVASKPIIYSSKKKRWYTDILYFL